MFNFERIVHKMSLIHDLTEFCDQEYKPHCQNDPCPECTHPSGKCSGSCLECSKQINYHTEGGRSLYNCQNYIYYYTVKYSWKYASEIMYTQVGIRIFRFFRTEGSNRFPDRRRIPTCEARHGNPIDFPMLQWEFEEKPRPHYNRP